MLTPDEEELNYEEDDSWYEEAMNALDSPLNNHHIVYSEEEIQELGEEEKQIIRLRNNILNKGFEYIDLQHGDYICDIVFFCSTIDYKECQFALTYRKEDQYLVIFKWNSELEVNPHPIQIAGMVKTSSHYGTYRFTTFLHLEEEITDDMEMVIGFKINRDLSYLDKPSLEVFRSDDVKKNQAIVDYLAKVHPTAFEFYNDFIIFELAQHTSLDTYVEVMDQLEKL